MKTLRVAICVMLIVGVLAMSLSVFADNDDSETDELYESLTTENTLYMIWATLRSWGIEIDIDELREWSDEASVVLYNLVLEYLASQPSISSFPTWIFPWKLYQDEWGIIRGNNNFLEDMQDFADWLVIHFALASNDIEYLQRGLAYTYDDTGKKYYAGEYNTQFIEIGTPLYVANKGVSESYPDIYWNNGQYKTTAYSNNNALITNIFTKLTNGNYEYIVGSIESYPTNNVNQLVVLPFYWHGGVVDGENRSAGIYLQVCSRYNSDGTMYPYRHYVWGVNLSVAGNDASVAIVTGEIIIPDDNEIQGQSLQIDDNKPIYVELDWPDTVDVGNLPVIITQKSIPDIGNDIDNPGFSVPWQAINGLIQYVAAPAGAIMALVNEAPVEGVIMLYALIGGIIIFGMIRIMREH